MASRKRSRRARGFGSSPEAHHSRWESEHEATLESTERLHAALAKGQCGRAAELLANVFYSHGRAAAESRAARNGGVEIPVAKEGLRARHAGAAEDAFKMQCLRKPGLLDRAKRALRKKS